MPIPKHILVIRLSAPGDVAMTIPVLHSFQEKFPGIKLTILTNRRLAAVFTGLNASLIFMDTKGEHKGVAGILRLFKQINQAFEQPPIDAVADLHNVLRSKILRTLFSLRGTMTASIDKGRSEKKKLTRKNNKVLKPLASSFERYRLVFTRLGCQFDFHFKSIFTDKPLLPHRIAALTGHKNEKWIGVAPFAAYPEKMYPLEKMEAVVSDLNSMAGQKIILFGSRNESGRLQDWAKKYPGVINVAGLFSLEEELKLMTWLDIMISMDSANMHFASLVNTPVMSVWGATHPFAGFMGWKQRIENVIQLDLYCRPCSVFGNKKCYRGDHACMTEIEPVSLTDKLSQLLRE